MNERIKELALQSGAIPLVGHDGLIISNLNVEKFAELIVKECADVCISATKEGQPLHLVSLGYTQRIKEHFGVK